MSKYHRRTFITDLIGAAFVPACVSASQPTDEWTYPRADRHNTGYAPIAGPSGIDVDWTRSFDSRVFHPPTPFKETCYVGTEDGRVVALDISSGETQWTAQIENRGMILPMTPTPERVFVPTQGTPQVDGGIFSLDRTTGTQRWQWEIDAAIDSPVMTDGEIAVFGTQDGRLFALDVDDGETQWSATIRTGRKSGIDVQPAIVDNQVIVRNTNGIVAAIEKTTGIELWRQSFKMGSRGSAVVRNDKVYVGGADHVPRGSATGQLYALDRTDGSQIWRREFDGPVFFHMVAGPDRLYASDGFDLHALDYEDGRTIWQVELNVRNALAGISDGLYVASADGISIYDPADGTERDRFEPDGKFLSSLTDYVDSTKFNGGPVPIPNGVLLTSTDGTVWALGGESRIPSIHEIAGGTGLLGLGAGAYALYRRRR